MEYDWESRKLLLDLSEDVKCEWWWNENTVYESALFWSELVSTVRSTDRDGERVAASACSEVDNLFWLCIVRLSSTNLILNTSEDTKLSLYCYVKLVSVVNDLLGESHVLLVWEV